MSEMKKPMVITSWVLQVIVAAIFVMAAIPKHTGDAGSVAMFEVLGAEPVGRYAAGSLELLAAILILIPRTIALGGVLSLGIMSGAIFSHLTKLGVSIDAEALGQPALAEAELEGPTMFIMASVVFVASLVVVVVRRSHLPIIGSKASGESA
jgi:putative oxidoreductase